MKKSATWLLMHKLFIICIASSMVLIPMPTAEIQASKSLSRPISPDKQQTVVKSNMPPASIIPKYTEPTDDEAAWLFQPSKVVQIQLDIPEESINALWADAYSYVSATFTMIDGETSYGPWQIEVKLKGKYGSFRDLNGKSAFKLKFPNKTERISGLKKLTLNNMVQDLTYTHEVMAYELYRSLGIPAPRTGYAVVTVNGVDYGLHLNLETLDDVSLPKWFGDVETGHLYEGNYGDWFGDMNDPYSGHYEVDEGDEDERSDLAALLAAANTEGEGWLSAVDALADLDQMIMAWAVERYIGHWDSYTFWLPNNYYFHSTVDGEFTMLPWGTDQTFSGPWVNGHLSFNDVNTPVGGVLWRRCMTTVSCLSQYADALVIVRDKVKELNLIQKGAALHYSLLDEIQADTRKEYNLGDSQFWRDHSLGFLTSRPYDLEAWLNSVPPAPSNVSVGFGNKRATVSWTPAEFAGPSLLTGYRIQYRQGTGAWSTLDVLDPTANSAQITGLVNGSTYKFRVSSMSSSGSLSHSPIYSRLIGLPNAITDMSIVRDDTKNQLAFSWRLPDAVGGGPLKFEVQYRKVGTDTWSTLWNNGRSPIDDQGTRRILLKNVADDENYVFRIRIHNMYGAGSWSIAR